MAELPDLSGISDPKVVDALKNLEKKDSTTKAKALEELQEYILPQNGTDTAIEDGVLEAWTALYPRTSIDNARRVRLLAHSLQGTVTALSAKRIVSYLPRLAGPWLSGTFDADRGVARAASDALEHAFPSPEKRDALWKIYKDSLLGYVEDAALTQTPQTLSDERTTSPDDAEAKHVRVAGNAVALLLRLLEVLQKSAAQGLPQPAIELLQRNELWEYAHHKDPFLRRSLYRLLCFCSNDNAFELPWQALSTSLLSKSLHIPQIGSATGLVEALLAVTKARPEIWTTDYTNKTRVSRRFLQMIRQGSQRGTEMFWSNLETLLTLLPIPVWTQSLEATAAPTLEDCRTLLKALGEGVRHADEPRPNLPSAWRTYVQTCFWLTTQISPEEGKQLVAECTLPLLQQDILQDPEQSQWQLSRTVSRQLLPQLIKTAIERGYQNELLDLLSLARQKLVETMKLSLPETSKDHSSSQTQLLGMSERFTAFQKQLNTCSETDAAKSVSKAITDSAWKLAVSAIELLKSRNGKPFGAAGLLRLELSLLSSNDPHESVDSFLKDGLPSLMGSPSAQELLQVLFLCRHYPNFVRSLDSCTEAISQLPSSHERLDLISILVSSLRPSDYGSVPELGNLVRDEVSAALAGDSARWRVIRAFCSQPVEASRPVSNGASAGQSADNTRDEILSQMMDALSIGQETEAALKGFNVLITDSGHTKALWPVKTIQDLTAKLLILRDSPSDSIAGEASSLIKKLKQVNGVNDLGSVNSSAIDLIQQQFNGLGFMMPLFSLIDLAVDTYNSLNGPEQVEAVDKLLPSSAQWQQAIAPFMSQPPYPALAITSPLGGLLYLVTPAIDSAAGDIRRDEEDLSLAFRLGLYVTRLVSETNILPNAATQLDVLPAYLPLIAQLTSDKITLEACNTLWLGSGPEILEEAQSIVTVGRAVAQNLFQSDMTARTVKNKLTRSLHSSGPLSGSAPPAYHHAEAFYSFNSVLYESSTPEAFHPHWEDTIRTLRRAPANFLSGFWLATYRDQIAYSVAGRKILNELIADATSIKEDVIPSIMTMRPVIYLNILLERDSQCLEEIPSQRLVFLYKNLIVLLESGKFTSGGTSEILKLIRLVSFRMVDVYGDYWMKLFQFLEEFFTSYQYVEGDLPMLHSSLKLLATLKGMTASEDVNEDLQEAWTDSKASIQAGLIQSLLQFKTQTELDNQPKDITTQLLRRTLRGTDITITESADLYSLFHETDSSVYQAAFDLLHQAIPAAQEQASLDVVLEGKTALLPAELLVLTTSSRLGGFSQDANARNVWDTLCCYLLGWKLVFDHFGKASYKLRGMYSENLKSAGQVPFLLDTICSIIKIISAHPVSPKADVDTFEIGWDRMEQDEVNELAIHLYHESLLYLPSLVKSWFIEQRNRIKDPLESYTQSHISPSIKSAAVASATTWSSTQDQSPTERPIKLTTSPKSNELTAKISIDDESPPISLSISLPGSFPLDQAIVTSRSRVGVSEKNWQSWLRTIQIIIFSTGSLVEGLVAFRRNVQGALKGQSECAICYSIIGTDMTTPSKRCGTCKNNFHSGCLFRWFKSSNSSSCPLCRNNFNYA